MDHAGRLVCGRRILVEQITEDTYHLFHTAVPLKGPVVVFAHDFEPFIPEFGGLLAGGITKLPQLLFHGALSEMRRRLRTGVPEKLVGL
jgi:hypothetical protein